MIFFFFRTSFTYYFNPSDSSRNCLTSPGVDCFERWNKRTKRIQIRVKRLGCFGEKSMGYLFVVRCTSFVLADDGVCIAPVTDTVVGCSAFFFSSFYLAFSEILWYTLYSSVHYTLGLPRRRKYYTPRNAQTMWIQRQSLIHSCIMYTHLFLCIYRPSAVLYEGKKKLFKKNADDNNIMKSNRWKQYVVVVARAHIGT